MAQKNVRCIIVVIAVNSILGKTITIFAVTVKESVVIVMAEYIEREAFIEILKETKKDCERYADKVVCDFAIRMANLMTTADVQKVRHGKNITTMNPVDEFECSECGFVCEIFENLYDDEYILDWQREYNPKFCPNCGAKMDKE